MLTETWLIIYLTCVFVFVFMFYFYIYSFFYEPCLLLYFGSNRHQSEDEDVIDLESLDRTANPVRNPLTMQKNIYVSLK